MERETRYWRLRQAGSQMRFRVVRSPVGVTPGVNRAFWRGADSESTADLYYTSEDKMNGKLGTGAGEIAAKQALSYVKESTFSEEDMALLKSGLDKQPIKDIELGRDRK